jgi:transcriptional regulator
MYIPKPFKETDRERIITLMQENAFATLITVQNGTPFASHIPFIIDAADSLKLSGHLAFANEQCKHLQADSSVLVIFQGPHTYISPSWYQNAGVPTWDYCAVHAHGKVKMIDSEDRLKQLVNGLTNHYEQSSPSPWQPKYPDKMLSAIVGFEIEVTDLQAKFKLSQNRALVDQLGVIQQLCKTDDASAVSIASLMKENHTHS